MTPASLPRPRPSEEHFADGHLAIGVIDDAIEEGPGSDVQGADMLIINAEVPSHGILHREVLCPISMPGSGRDLIGQTISFRHTTHDPNFINDALVVGWPPMVSRALEPTRFEGPGALRARAWRFLAGFSMAVTCIGIMLTPVLLCGIIVGGDMFADLPAWFHPGVAVASSVGAAMLGLFAVAVCNRRMNAALRRT
ncbi:hypothetical protein [Gordonia sp. MP11Mi]|uniref:hypothetical protein n=1 Tax=Gordonia sp. MP11Mi TaxID=3022769 RepID=UPI003B226F73